jgi:ribonuclease-3
MAPHSARDDRRLDPLELGQQVTGHTFSDPELVRRAFTHPSAIENRDASVYYERLEFLGDSVLGMIIAEEIYRRFPTMPEGGMTRIKVRAVSGSALARVARDLEFNCAIIFGDSERGTGGRGMARALENVYEALTAALYIDAGLEKTREWVIQTLGHLLIEDAAKSPENPKSALQEFTQSYGRAPVYRMVGHEGPPHARTFEVTVTVAGKQVGSGVGRSKKEAEAQAAQAALAVLKAEHKKPPS